MKKGFWTLRYTIINVLYFAAFCTIHAYATVFLLDRGFTNTMVGVALAVSNILAVLGQPLVAGMIDKSERITNRKVLLCSVLIILTGVLLLMAVGNNIPLVFALYVIIYTVQFISMSIMIAMSFEYQAGGCEHNFGLARGLGSAGFAVTSAITGRIMAQKGPVINLYITSVVMILMFVAVFTFRRRGDTTDAPVKLGGEIDGGVKPDEGSVKPDAGEIDGGVKPNSGEEPINNFFDFIRTYPTFMLFLLGAALCFFSHNMLNDYLILIIRNLGGGETELGYASFLQAILELPVMAVMAGLLKKINVKAILVFSTVAFFIKVVIMYLATGLGGMYLSQSFQLFAYAVFIPATAFYSDRIMREKDKVKGQAYVNCAITLGGVFSSLICGKILDVNGVSYMLFIGMIVAFVGAVISALALVKGNDGKSKAMASET